MEVPHQIPKIIHYCWFGKTSLPEDAQRCIASWKKFCPDYEIVEWNETKIDLSALPLYVQQAYAAQKWAFVADYVRLYALIRYGGVYMDTDVELVAPLDRFMNQAAFAGLEDASHVATCVMACEPEFPLFKEFLLQYSNMQFLNPDGTLNTTTNVSRLTDICLERGMLQNGQCQSVAGLTIYPADYFCPLALDTGLLKQTENTVAIHWFAESRGSMNNKLEKSKKLIQNVFLFFLASFIPKTISFFMVPLYTECLSTLEYGTIDLITTTVQLLLPILTLQVQDAILRFSVAGQDDPRKVFSIGLRIVSAGFVFLASATFLLTMLGVVDLNGAYIAFFLASYLTGALGNVVNYFLRALDKVKEITIASVITCLITVSCNLLFLLIFRWGVNGYLLANILGHVLSLLYLMLAARLGRYISFRINDSELTRRIIVFSLPMIVSALSWWINNSLDKYILSFFCGVSATGLLAVAYKVPTIISTLGATISKAYSVSVLQNFDPTDKDGFLGQSYAVISFSMVLCSSALMLINIPLSRLLFAKEFYATWQFVPPLLLSALFNYMSLSCENMCLALNRTRLISSTALIGAGINTFLNLCMIPLLGSYGAAVATAIGFFCVWMMRYIWILRHIQLKNARIKEPLSYGLLWGQMFAAYWGNRLLLLQICIFVVLIFLYWREFSQMLHVILKRISSLHCKGTL